MRIYGTALSVDVLGCQGKPQKDAYTGDNMTRINLVPVQELCNQHLLAEHREIKRIPNAILSGKAVLDGNYGYNYKLGKGHVKFFYNKLTWLYARYCEIYDECIKRGLNVHQYHYSFTRATLHTMYIQDMWHPTPDEIAISRERINARLLTMKVKTWT